jgi:transposase
MCLTLWEQYKMPVQAIARLVGANDARLWRILRAYVNKVRDEIDFSGVTDVGIDATSCRKGHHYITLFVDVKDSRVWKKMPELEGE